MMQQQQQQRRKRGHGENNNNNGDENNGVGSPHHQPITSTSIIRGTKPTPYKNKKSKKEKTKHEIRCISLYQQYIEQLNKKMVEWAKDKLHKIQTGYYNHMGNEPVLFTNYSYEYLRISNFLKERYKSPPGMEIYSFGSNDCFQIDSVGYDNDGDIITPTNRPIKANNLSNVDIVQISAGGLHTAAVNKYGQVYTWGCNDDGALGKFTNSDTEQIIPSIVKDMIPSKYSTVIQEQIKKSQQRQNVIVNEDNSIIKVATGDSQTLALSITGNVYEWGCFKDKEGKSIRIPRPPDDNTVDPIRGEDDDGNKTIRIDIGLQGRHCKPTHVYHMPKKVIDIDCGFSFNAAILEDNTLVTWGVGTCGEMSRSDDMTSEMTVEKDVDTGVDYKTYNIQKLIDIYRKTNEEKIIDLFMIPKHVKWTIPPPSIKVKRDVLSVACGGYHLLVIARDNYCLEDTYVYSSGLNTYGQLGLNTTKNTSSLTRIEKFEVNIDDETTKININNKITKVAAGTHYSIALDNTGTNLFGWGRSDYGSLGLTDTLTGAGSYVLVPTQIKFPLVVDDNNPNNQQGQDDEIVINDISCGSTHTIVVTQDGQSVYTFGFGEVGALGHGKDKDECRPRKIKQVDIYNDNNNNNGNGNNSKKSSSNAGLPASIVRQVSGGGQHTVLLMEPL